MVRFHIDSDGFVWRNGVAARLTTLSYFGGGEYPCMHFKQEHWHNHDVVYPEVPFEEMVSDDFCWPRGGGQCEFETLPDGRIQIRAYHISTSTPVLEIIFPNPEMYHDAIYTAFMHSTGREIIDWASDENSRHMQEMRQIEIYLGYVPGCMLIEVGAVRRDLDVMTAFSRIELLERIYEVEGASRRLPGSMWAELGRFLQSLDKEGFRTGND